MVAMCLVKDQTKRPTAEKLLKHSFFKSAKPPELTMKGILTDLPPLWDRVKALQVITFFCFFSVLVIKTLYFICDLLYFQLKDAAQLALKKMPSSEQEALSLVCYIKPSYLFSVSVWSMYV
jgi:hypothetical protein